VLDRLPGWVAAGAVLLFLGEISCCPVFCGESLTDPTQPPVMTATQAVQNERTTQKWRLTSTVTGLERRVAVINHQVVKIGEPVDGAVLVGVAPGSAFLIHEGRRLHLRLKVMSVKQSLRTTP
jgi:hypothetical protein